MSRRLVSIGLIMSMFYLVSRADEKKALEVLQGEWKLVSLSKLGRAEKAEAIADVKLSVDGSKLQFTGGRKPAQMFKYQIDPSKSPASIDLTVKERGKEQSIKGIYKVEKDRFTLCIVAGDCPEKKRPKEFKSTEKDCTLLFVFERTKK